MRIPIRWNAHAEVQSPYTIDPAFSERIDWVIEKALSCGLVTIINIHYYDALMERPEDHHARFRVLWRQIAEHCQALDSNPYFELLNEPHDDLEGALWNSYLADALTVVRESNPDRIVAIGPDSWNDLSELPRLEIPEDDRRLIVAFHYYDPFRFTHKGAEWVEGAD